MVTPNSNMFANRETVLASQVEINERDATEFCNASMPNTS